MDFPARGANAWRQLGPATFSNKCQAEGFSNLKILRALLRLRRRLIKIIGGREGEGDIEEFEINWDWSHMNFDELEDVRDRFDLVSEPEEALEDL